MGPFDLLPLRGRLKPGYTYQLVRGVLRKVPVDHQPTEEKPVSEVVKKVAKKGEGKRTVNNLKMPERYKLAAVLTEWKKEIVESRPPKQAIADRATTALGFTVTVSNVRAAANDLGWGQEWRATRGTGRGSGLTRANIYTRVELLEQQVSKMQAAIIDLFNQLGTDVPLQISDEWPTSLGNDQKEGE